MRTEQLEDKGITVGMRALERGVEPDERVMGEKAHALWRLKEHLWLDTGSVLRTTGSTEAGRVVCLPRKEETLGLFGSYKDPCGHQTQLVLDRNDGSSETASAGVYGVSGH